MKYINRQIKQLLVYTLFLDAIRFKTLTFDSVDSSYNERYDPFQLRLKKIKMINNDIKEKIFSLEDIIE